MYEIIFITGIIYIITEICFYIYIHHVLLPSLNFKFSKIKLDLKTSATITKKFCRVIAGLRHYNFNDFLSGWILHNITFTRSKPGDILIDNVHSLFAWIIFDSSIQQLNETQLKTVKNICNNFDGLKMQEGYNSSLRHADYSLIPIIHSHHPLIIYLLFGIYVQWGNYIYLNNKGFKIYQTLHGMSYWFRKGDSHTLPPLLIFHGINSIGWSIYYPLIKAIGCNRTIILVNYDSIKLCTLCLNVVGPDLFNKNILYILDTHYINSFSILGHSWGTFLAGWVIKKMGHRIHHVTFIDPVAITIYLPDTVYTMFYKTPQTISDHLLRYFLTNDITIAHNIQRHFEWYDVVVFLEDIPHHIGMVISISTKDDFICSKAAIEIVDQYISIRSKNKKASPVRKIIWENFKHTDAIMNLDAVNKIAETVQQNELII